MPQLFKAQMVDEVLHTMNHEQSQEQGGRALVHYAAPTVVRPIYTLPVTLLVLWSTGYRVFYWGLEIF